VEHAYTRARELCRQVGETPQLFPALLGLSVFHMVRAEYQTARELGEQCLSLARRVQDPALITATQSVLGMILYNLGEFPLARAHAEQGIALYDPQQPRSWLDHGVSCLWSAASALLLLGYPEQALQRSDEMVTLAQELSHPSSLGFALYFAAGLRQFRREAQAAQGRAEAAIALATEQGLPSWLANGTVQRGWALAVQGQGEAGIAQLHQGLAAHRATGEEVARPYALALLAEAYGKVEQPKEGLTALAEALALVDQTGERFYEAELYRLKGQLTLQKFQVSSFKFQVENSLGSSVQSLESEAEECFHKAIEIARRQQAKSLELRAVMSLSRLWQQQGKKEEARQMLAEIYGWFTEGFDTQDLRDAKALLAELAEGH
jgi:predicted ATPase